MKSAYIVCLLSLLVTSSHLSASELNCTWKTYRAKSFPSGNDEKLIAANFNSDSKRTEINIKLLGDLPQPRFFEIKLSDASVPGIKCRGIVEFRPQIEAVTHIATTNPGMSSVNSATFYPRITCAEERLLELKLPISKQENNLIENLSFEIVAIELLDKSYMYHDDFKDIDLSANFTVVESFKVCY